MLNYVDGNYKEMDPTQPKHSHKSIQETEEEKSIEGVTVDIVKWSFFPLATKVHIVTWGLLVTLAVWLA